MSKIAYDLKKIKGLIFDVDGVLSPSTVPLCDDGTPARMANVKDGYALKIAVEKGYKIAIISGGESEIVERRFQIIGINDVFMGVDSKLPAMKQWLSSQGLAPDEVIYAGDDIPDYDCMLYAGLSVAPLDAATEIKEVADYICPCMGGMGVARDLIEQVMKAKGEWLKLIGRKQ